MLVDTSAILALADARSRSHVAVRTYLSSTSDLLSVPVTVLPELDYMLAERFGVQLELRIMRSISSGDFLIEQLTAGDLPRSLDLVEQYADSNIGLVDASIVAIAERLRITRILTLDHRHFRMFRPRHCETFELVP